jgi:hypothetical protein
MATGLLGMTRFSAYAFYILAVLYAGLAAYVLLGGWVRKANRQRFRLLWILVLPTVVFIMLWFCGRGIWGIVFWSFVFGDAGPYEEYGRWVAAIVALLVAATILGRLSWGFASRRYLRICFAGTIALAAIFSAMWAQEFGSRIYGWSARGAAENYLAKLRVENHPFIDPNAPRRIAEEKVPQADPHSSKVNRRFVLYYGNAPIQYVHVAPHGWFWWTLAGSGPAYPFSDMDWAVAHWDTDREEATERLNAVIRNYPNSEASRSTSATLKTLREHGSGGAPSWKAEMLRRLQEETRKRRM